MYEMILNLDGEKKNLYEQIYEYIREEIRKGRIRCGERLPSTRILAGQLDVSRSTAQLAYEQLLSEGYIEAVPCKGYFVCEMDGLYHLEQETAVSEENETTETRKYLYDFTPNGIDLEHFPYAVWRKLSREVLQDDQKELFHLGDPKGEYALRKAISSYLHQARGVNAQPSQIVIGAGNDYLQMLLSRMLGTKQRIAMESPGYRHAYDIFQRLGYDCCTVSMDRYGMDVRELWESGADMAYVMPSHQYPMGIVMPVRRRQELLQWASEKEGRYIIEDDYDSEFRYDGGPIPSLFSMDKDERVIYINTFSKSLAPSMRMGYMVLPPALYERYIALFGHSACVVPLFEQKTLAAMLDGGCFERHIGRLRTRYREVRQAIYAAAEGLGDRCRIHDTGSGLHLLAEFPQAPSEEFIKSAARERGINVKCLTDYLHAPAPVIKNCAVVNYSGATPQKIAAIKLN